LKQFAKELKDSVRSTDLVGRLGGDEFLVVVNGTAGDLEVRIAHIKKQVSGVYFLPDGEGKRKVEITAAVGIAVWKPGDTAEALLAASDAAMYEDKKRMSGTQASAPRVSQG
jgi:diguanylate cyclase (GGDEF)-like protein